MTQKGSLFKGIKKKKSIPPNRHGKVPSTRKGLMIGRFYSLFFIYFYDLVLIYLSLLLLVAYWASIYITGKRFVKPSKVTKEMETDRVSHLFHL